jgi:DNA-binding transcriptional regulator YbjK
MPRTTHASAARRPRTPPEEVRAAIVDATVRLIGMGGTAAVTHRAVAQEAGVSLSSTTYHFASKTDIVDAALRHVVSTEIERIRSSAEATAETVTDVESLIDAMSDWFAEQLESDLLVVRAGYELQLETRRSPELEALHTEWGLAVRDLATEVLARAGSPRPRQDAHILAAFIDGERLQEITHPRPDVAQRARPVLSRLLRALIPPREGS